MTEPLDLADEERADVRDFILCGWAIEGDIADPGEDDVELVFALVPARRQRRRATGRRPWGDP